MTGAERIMRERLRQMEVEGFDPAHDDREHPQGELLLAADCYLACVMQPDPDGSHEQAPDAWPWDPGWWKPQGDIRNLERAGALIAAEIDRLLRQGQTK